MNRVVIVIIAVIVALSAIFTAVAIFKQNNFQVANVVQEEQVADEEILDECTDEYEQIQSESLAKVNSSQEKITPNASITLKKIYSKCGHTTNEYSTISNDLVNKTENELKELYPKWKVESFSSNKIVLSQECEGECGEHYIIRDVDGLIVVYNVLENGEEVEYLKTEISTQYLTSTDKSNMQDGIKIYGKEVLNQFIEDFE